ncbi:hypothetical protein M2272_000704 [Mycobacterium frederiksbergense]|uniref:IstB-like ATP-binding domain-containing protein n=1 Tax=Mycolicibacterium frederiksbergense TaxID=117567 RepID=A0ABT6KTP4_9MYCO|nr:hypothetical protein [Mycolicibacterium frederiksbergense]
MGDFDFDANPSINPATIHQLAVGDRITKGKPLCLIEAAGDKQLTKTINRYGRVDLLLLDELGYMELDKRGAELLFQVLTEREEKNAITHSYRLAHARSQNGIKPTWWKTYTHGHGARAVSCCRQPSLSSRG